MILYGFCVEESKKHSFSTKNLKHKTKNLQVRPKPNESKFSNRGFVVWALRGHSHACLVIVCVMSARKFEFHHAEVLGAPKGPNLLFPERKTNRECPQGNNRLDVDSWGLQMPNNFRLSFLFLIFRFHLGFCCFLPSVHMEICI